MRRLVALLLAAGAVSACNDEDGGSAPNAKSQFVRQADRVCQGVRRRDAPLRDQLVALARPGTPTARYLAGLEQVAALQGRLADAAGAGDRERYDALTEELNPIAYRTAGIAQGYGLRICGSSVG